MKSSDIRKLISSAAIGKDKTQLQEILDLAISHLCYEELEEIAAFMNLKVDRTRANALRAVCSMLGWTDDDGGSYAHSALADYLSGRCEPGNPEWELAVVLEKLLDAQEWESILKISLLK